MHFIAVDLIGKFKPSPQVLNVFCMLTDYTWFIVLFTRKPDEVVHTYLVYMYSKLSGSLKILSDKCTELKLSCSHMLLPVWE